MKKLFFNNLVIALVVLASGIWGCNQKPPPKLPLVVNVTKTIPQADPLIPVVLPPTAKVILKEGQPKSGRLTAINPKTQQITLFSGKDSNIAIATIDRVAFEGEVILRSSGKIVIRGEKNKTSPGSNQKTWTEPLENFSWRDLSQGKAAIQLTSVPQDELIGIQSVAVDSTYVVEEMRFEPLENIQIKVIPH